MKRFTRISMATMLLLVLTMVLALPIYAQQPTRQGPSEPAGQQDTATTPNVQQPRDSNTTTQGPDTSSPNVNRQTSSPTGTTQPGPISSDYPATTTSTSPNWVLAIVSLAIGLGIGYLLGKRSPGMHTSTGAGMPTPGRA